MNNNNIEAYERLLKHLQFKLNPSPAIDSDATNDTNIAAIETAITDALAYLDSQKS